MKRVIKSKIGRIINFIKIEGKFKRADIVQILNNTSDKKEYDKYIGKFGIVTDIDYSDRNKPIGIKFKTGVNLCYGVDEIKKLSAEEEMTKVPLSEMQELLKKC